MLTEIDLALAAEGGSVPLPQCECGHEHAVGHAGHHASQHAARPPQLLRARKLNQLLDRKLNQLLVRN